MTTTDELLSKTSIDYKNKTYNVIDTFEATDLEGRIDFVVYETDQTKIKKLYAWYPLWIGKKFRWFKYVEVKYVFYISIRKIFDEWTYSRYWDSPEGEWRMKEILN